MSRTGKVRKSCGSLRSLWRCREEILRVLGKEKVSVADLHLLPYVQVTDTLNLPPLLRTQATIAEVQRISCVAPVSVFHSTTVPTSIGQYSFPAKSTFISNLSFIMNDPEHIRDPHIFDPTRFLSENGRWTKRASSVLHHLFVLRFAKNERLVPFGLGRRYCMGEILARNEVFIFTVNLIQSRKFLKPRHAPCPDPRNYICNLTRIPDDFHMQVVQVPWWGTLYYFTAWGGGPSPIRDEYAVPGNDLQSDIIEEQDQFISKDSVFIEFSLKLIL